MTMFIMYYLLQPLSSCVSDCCSPSLFLSSGELSGQVLSFAANTFYMAISCSNLQPKTEPGENPVTGKITSVHHFWMFLCLSIQTQRSSGDFKLEWGQQCFQTSWYGEIVVIDKVEWESVYIILMFINLKSLLSFTQEVKLTIWKQCIHCVI